MKALILIFACMPWIVVSILIVGGMPGHIAFQYMAATFVALWTPLVIVAALLIRDALGDHAKHELEKCLFCHGTGTIVHRHGATRYEHPCGYCDANRATPEKAGAA